MTTWFLVTSALGAALMWAYVRGLAWLGNLRGQAWRLVYWGYWTWQVTSWM